MKASIVLTFALLALVSFGCQSETVAPRESVQPIVNASVEGIQRPTNACGSSQFVNFVDANNVVMGAVEILNTESELFVLVDMSSTWLLQGIKIFAGNSLDLPKSGNGLIQVEEFPSQFMNNRPIDQSTYRVRLNNALPSCFGVSIFGQAARLNMFGQVTSTRQVWADGTVVLNGKMLSFCKGVCAPTVQDAPEVTN